MDQVKFQTHTRNDCTQSDLTVRSHLTACSQTEIDQPTTDVQHKYQNNQSCLLEYGHRLLKETNLWMIH